MTGLPLSGGFCKLKIDFERWRSRRDLDGMHDLFSANVRCTLALRSGLESFKLMQDPLTKCLAAT